MVQETIDLDGIKRAITAGVKTNTTGLGAQADEWSFQWWDHVFNKATSTIKIETDQEGEVLFKKDTEKDSKLQEKKLLYGAFIKSGFLSV